MKPDYNTRRIFSTQGHALFVRKQTATNFSFEVLYNKGQTIRAGFPTENSAYIAGLAQVEIQLRSRLAKLERALEACVEEIEATKTGGINAEE